MRTLCTLLCLLTACVVLSSCDLNPQLNFKWPANAEADNLRPSGLEEAMNILSQGGDAESNLPGMERNFEENHESRHAYHMGMRKNAINSEDPYNWFSAWETLSQRQFPGIEARWHSLNPDINGRKTSGRVLSIAFDPVDGRRIWIGTASSGLWLADRGSSRWTPLMDSLPPLGISAIAINPQNPDHMMVGMDTITVNFAAIPSIPDAGVFVSKDAGKTWDTKGANLQPGNSIASSDPLHVNHLVWHPVDTNKVFMAANTGIWLRPAHDQQWTPANEETLPQAKAQSVLIDQQNPQIITAAFKNRGIFRSSDGGQSWTDLSEGAPPTVDYYLEDIWQSQGAYFASYIKRGRFEETLVMKLLPQSTSWKLYFHIDKKYTMFAVSPHDSTLMFLGGVGLNRLQRSATSELVLTPQKGVHVDQHNIGFHPRDSRILFAINDGGVFVPKGDGEENSWAPNNSGLQNQQLYSIGQSTKDSTSLLMNAQDQGVHYRHPNMIWKSILVGDGMETLFQTDNPDTTFIFSVEACGQLYQYYFLNTPPYALTWGNGPDSLLNGIAYHPLPTSCSKMPRAFWKAPYSFNPEDGRYMYTAMISGIYRSENRAKSWRKVADIDSVSILTVDPSSPKDIYAYKRSNGSLHHSSDRGSTWDSLETNLFANIQDVSVDPDHAGVLYTGRVSSSGQVHRSDDQGLTWTDISGNFAALGIPVMSINVTPRLPNGQKYIFIGTDLGLFVSDADDPQNQWHFIHGALPYAIVMDIHYNPINNSIRVATFGRGVWQMTLPTDFLPQQVL